MEGTAPMYGELNTDIASNVNVIPHCIASCFHHYVAHMPQHNAITAQSQF